MQFKRKATTFFFALMTVTARGQITINSDTLKKNSDLFPMQNVQKQPLKAIDLLFVSNMGVWSYDRFVSRDSFAMINLSTIRDNFRTGFVWDNDGFKTNLFLHPFHGGTYFNAARSNGMNFWESIPFAACGSLSWEMFMENEPPAINDFFATTIGGTCLGEMNFRISDLIIDDRTRGLERFGREALLTVVSPMRGINRIISGTSFRHQTEKGNTLPGVPITFYSSLGHRFLSSKHELSKDVENMVNFNMGLFYGNPFSEDNDRPYDYFSLKVGGNLFSQQSFISNVNALGMIYSTTLSIPDKRKRLVVGVFQHFNFYQSRAVLDYKLLNPYKISEAASAGPGMMYQVSLRNNNTFSCSVHLSGIALGGSFTDHYKYKNRDYNMGSGLSTKANFELLINNKLRFFLNSEHYRIYSWIGYNPYKSAMLVTNVQGDKGHAILSVANLNINYRISPHFYVSTGTGYYFRRSVYAYYPTVNHRVFENKISAGYIFQ